MLGKVFELVGFISKDFAQFWAQRNVASSFQIWEFFVGQRFATRDGIGLDFHFALENKLRALNAVSAATFSMDGVCVPFSWLGDGPAALAALERRAFRAHTGAIPGKAAGPHECRLEIVDSAGRRHEAAFTLLVVSNS
jgi:hypothetical protein